MVALMWVLAFVVSAGILYRFLFGWLLGGAGRKQVRVGENKHQDKFPRRDLNANINPSQSGNETNLWPDRTGPQTRRELGARQATDVTFVGDRVEQKMQAGTGARRDPQPGPHERGPGTANADLPPEDQFGEDRPAQRTTAPDEPPTQWHPENHGAPGDHYRDGHHRSATAPERHSDATDPFAHAPTSGPNHMPPDAGQAFPPDVHP